MILGTVGVILALIAALVAIATTRPDEFTVERSAEIPAPLETVFEQVNNLRRWHDWSPWAKLDPKSVTTYEGPEAGVGAILRWKGNNQVGEGSMTITESRPLEIVRLRLEFLKPFKATNSAAFTFSEQAGVTAVTWSMSGKNNLISKLMSLFMNCEKMIGSQFEKGLRQLREVSTASTAA